MPYQPSPEDLRTWLAHLRDLGGAGLSEAEAIDELRLLEELKSAASAAQARVTEHLYADRSRREAAEGVPAAKRCAGLGAEVALARRVSPHQGNSVLGVALALTREMPATLAALSAGRLSEWAAAVVVRETAVLTAEHRLEVDRQLAPRLADPDCSGWGVRRLGNEARRIGYRLDPGAAVRRTRKAANDRRVSLRPAPDAMTYLTALLPVAQGVACYAALAREADSTRALGEEVRVRGRGQIMADTLVERITGQSIASGPPVEVELVMTDRTLLEGHNEPAHLVGYGTIPAPIGRELVRDAEEAWVRRLFTHPESGSLVAIDSKRRRFGGQLRHQIVLTDDTCATPWCDAPARHADHPTPVAEGGKTSLDNAAGLCEACNCTKELPGWTATILPRSDGSKVLDLTSPTGHRHRSRAPDPPGAPDPLEQRLRALVGVA